MKLSLPSFLRSRRIVRLANRVIESREHFVGLANDFVVLQDNFVQLSPYGDFPHSGPVNPRTKTPIYPKGCIQRLDNAAAAAMVKQFDSLAGRAGRLFGGLPWYIGHPDVDPMKYPDPKAYGWIMKLENRNDGLYAQVKWTPTGEELKTEGSFKYFSPYWDGIDTGNKDANGRVIIMPNELNSAGFTNKPNIPVMPLANEAPLDDNPTQEIIAAHVLITDAIERRILLENERVEWLKHFSLDYSHAAFALANAGTSEGAKKGWETRRAGMAAKDPAKKAAKVAARAAKTLKPSKLLKSYRSEPKAGDRPAHPGEKPDYLTKKGPFVSGTKPPPLPKTPATPPPPSIAARVAAKTSKLFRRS